MTNCRLLSLAEASRRLGVSERTLRRWCEKGAVRVIRIAGRPRIPEEVLVRLVEDANPDNRHDG